jgi:hypothetical protein
MEIILLEIQSALNARLFYIALSISLTLPDICSALESSDGAATKERYELWCVRNFTHKFSKFTEKDCYRLRCGLVHQGRFGHPNMQYSRVVFTLPNGSGITFTDCISNDVYITDAEHFCREMINSCRNWYETNKSNPIVNVNLDRLVQFRPMGLHPHFVGSPVIS